ncbi:Transcription factor che-1 [Fasciola hepatica]|uniref:Transcription factor che-1 n=1 Tax=Fasciola hepatica TaxID=6192 RepID=A0A2H1C4F8_FASHE|nr:Transcription factor che-1 [Fasciola hepatica]
MAPTVNSTCPLKFESGLALANFSSICAPQSSSEQSSIFSGTLLNDSVAGSRWAFGHVAGRELPSRCPTSTVKSEEPMFTQVGTRFVPAPMFCPSAPLITSTRPNITGSFPSSRAIQLVSQTTLSSSAPGTFASPQSSLSFLLTTDSNRPRVLSNSLPTDQNSNSNTLNYLNLPLQVLQALPNLRPGMSILLNVKNNRPNGQPNVVTSMPLESQSFSSVNTKKTDGTVFLLPSSQIPVCIASQIQAPQVMPTQRPCQLNSNLNQTVLFMPSISSSSTNSAILSGGSGSLVGASPTGTLSGAPSAFPSGTQFLLLRSPAKPDSKPTEVTQISNVNATSETTFLISTNLSQKTPIKSSGLLLIPHTVPPPVTQQSCTFPNLANQLHFQTVGSNLLDVSTMPSWGYRPPETQDLFGLSSGSACVQLGLGQPNSTVQNALLAAALSRSISNSMTASTLSLPIAVLPSNPQTVLMSPSTSVLQPSSSSGHLLPSHLASFISTTTIANTPVITTGSSSSVNLDPSLKLTMATQPGHSSASVSNIPTSPTASSAPDNMIAYVPVSTSSPHTSIFPSKKLVVLPSADNLLCSSSRPSLSSGCTLSISASCSRANEQPEAKFPVLSSDVGQPISPCVLPSPTGTLYSTKSASPAPQSNTLGHVNYRRRHQCPYCPKSCERKDNLQAHIRTHTGERPYPCRFCPKAFPQKDHLRAHIRTHTGEKPYRCPQCMKAFAQLGNLHRHVKTHKR